MKMYGFISDVYTFLLFDYYLVIDSAYSLSFLPHITDTTDLFVLCEGTNFILFYFSGYTQCAFNGKCHS